jgi:hypothetical protein
LQERPSTAPFPAPPKPVSKRTLSNAELSGHLPDGDTALDHAICHHDLLLRQFHALAPRRGPTRRLPLTTLSSMAGAQN